MWKGETRIWQARRKRLEVRLLWPHIAESSDLFTARVNDFKIAKNCADIEIFIEKRKPQFFHITSRTTYQELVEKTRFTFKDEPVLFAKGENEVGGCPVEGDHQMSRLWNKMQCGDGSRHVEIMDEETWFAEPE